MKMLIEYIFNLFFLVAVLSSYVFCTNEVTYEEPKQVCTYFYDNRFAEYTSGLVNCSWYTEKACCKRTEVTSVFSKMGPLFAASKTCANMMNYLMCFFCSPDQHIWYKQRARVCSDFCTDLYDECKDAEFKGEKIGSNYENGSMFCEAQDFSVADSGCFKFDPKVFDGAVQHLNYFLPFVTSLIMIVSVLII